MSDATQPLRATLRITTTRAFFHRQTVLGWFYVETQSPDDESGLLLFTRVVSVWIISSYRGREIELPPLSPRSAVLVPPLSFPYFLGFLVSARRQSMHHCKNSENDERNAYKALFGAKRDVV